MKNQFASASIVINEKIRAALDEHGFAVVDFLSTTDLNALQECYAEYGNEFEKSASNGIHMTNWLSSKELKLKINDALETILKKSLAAIFTNYTSSNHVFIVKHKHKISNFPLHQDWSFVDEEKYQSLNVWIALQHTAKENGGLQVVPGSHKFFSKVRGPGKLSLEFQPFQKTLKKYLVPLTVKAGQAVIFHHALLHGSDSNEKSLPRVIVSASVIPANADMLINFWDEAKEKILRFHVGKNFSLEYEDVRTEGAVKFPINSGGEELHGLMPYQLSPDLLKEKLSSLHVERGNNFWQKLFSR